MLDPTQDIKNSPGFDPFSQRKPFQQPTDDCLNKQVNADFASDDVFKYDHLSDNDEEEKC